MPRSRSEVSVGATSEEQGMFYYPERGGGHARLTSVTGSVLTDWQYFSIHNIALCTTLKNTTVFDGSVFQ